MSLTPPPHKCFSNFKFTTPNIRFVSHSYVQILSDWFIDRNKLTATELGQNIGIKRKTLSIEIINLIGNCLFDSQSKTYKRISVKFGTDVQFTIMKILRRTSLKFLI